jgi:serine/threonine protein phosphatase 1
MALAGGGTIHNSSSANHAKTTIQVIEFFLRARFEIIPLEPLRFLEERCRDSYEDGDFISVHGGAQSHVDPGDETTDRLHRTTLRNAQAHRSGRIVICGHSSQKSGRISDLGRTICIETGLTSKGSLAGLNLDEWTSAQVSQNLDVTIGSRQRQPSAGL